MWILSCRLVSHMFANTDLLLWGKFYLRRGFMISVVAHLHIRFGCLCIFLHKFVPRKSSRRPDFLPSPNWSPMHLYRQCTLPCCISLPDCAIFLCHPPWQSTNHRCTYTPDLSVRETQGCSCGEEAKTNHSRVRTMVGTNNHPTWWSYQQLNHVITPRYHRLPPSDPWTGWFLYFSVISKLLLVKAQQNNVLR